MMGTGRKEKVLGGENRNLSSQVTLLETLGINGEKKKGVLRGGSL